MRTLSVETPTHGRVLIEDAASSSASPSLLVGFHGYGQNAEDMLEDLKRIQGSNQWTLVSIQALYRFYARGEKTVASWMTRQDRELAIADNIRYVDQVMKELVGQASPRSLVFVGFSQGVAMAYRAAVLGAYRAGCIVAVGGDLPPELRPLPVQQFPSIFIAAGDRDPYYTPAKADEDEKFLRSRGLRHQVFRYSAGHEWTDELREQIHVVLNRVMSGRELDSE